MRDGEVSVRDHGPGIDEADLPYVFDRFYRAAGGARPAGLRASGLAIVRQVAESHGGTVTAERAARRRRAAAPASCRVAGRDARCCVAVISDTHMAAGGRRRLPERCVELIRGVATCSCTPATS